MAKERIKILKIGGKVLDDDVVMNELLAAFSKIKDKKIIVHGGGKKVDSI
ncbi:MAG: acetylglutamate kinase, partial [Francisellaceae bacterium]